LSDIRWAQEKLVDAEAQAFFRLALDAKESGINQNDLAAIINLLKSAKERDEKLEGGKSD